jgi:4-alpha-glucanotransferase
MQRSSGILLHPTALPGRHGVGSLGSEARRFLDFLSSAGQRVWQVLPLGPTGYGNSPYNALSAFAGNPLLIDLDNLVLLGDLLAEEVNDQTFEEGLVTEVALRFKSAILKKAAGRFLQQAGPIRRAAFDLFSRTHAAWLEDYVLFMALREHFAGESWSAWPDELRRREPSSLNSWRDRLAPDLMLHRYQQYIFFEQWLALKSAANQLGISILGDVPIFVAYDSADVWAHQELFQLDAMGHPLAVAGVPPDYFSETGQLWGNPLYDWRQLKRTGFRWWVDRFHRELLCADLVRLDHFRGFQACWSVPAGEETAINGHWEEVPGDQLFVRLQEEFPVLPIIAEDLGVITPEVERLRQDFNFPGMKVLQFAFDSGPDNPYLPHNYEADCVVYTGTHDNNTTLGWWRGLSAGQRRSVAEYLVRKNPDMPWDLISLAETSAAGLCILPCQDILGLDEKSRFNTPGKPWDNWTWRLCSDQLTPALEKRLRDLCRASGRVD